MMALQSASVQSNRWLETQCSSSASSRQIMVICAMGPPQVRKPHGRDSWPYGWRAWAFTSAVVVVETLLCSPRCTSSRVLERRNELLHVGPYPITSHNQILAGRRHVIPALNQHPRPREVAQVAAK